MPDAANTSRWLLLRSIAAFVFMLVLCDAVAGLALDALARRALQRDPSQAYFGYQVVDSPVVVLGSSRAEYHYVSSVLAQALDCPVTNLGINGRSADYAAFLVDGMLRRYRPRLVILDLRRVVLGWEGAGGRAGTLGFVAPVLRLCPGAEASLGLTWRERMRYESLACLSYNSSFVLLLTHALHPPQGDGYRPLEGPFRDHPEAEPDIHPDSDTQGRALEHLIRTCREHQVRLLCVLSPMYDQQFRKEGAEVTRFLEQHGVRFFDYTEDPRFVGEASLFSDPDHLNGRGSQLFTRDLAARLRAAAAP